MREKTETEREEEKRRGKAGGEENVRRKNSLELIQ
jgi:hypothetical protein